MAKLKVKLKQHTPLIHFQHEQSNSILRATELKPKLDKFLITHAFKNKFQNYKKFLVGYEEKKTEKDYGDKKALNYKVRIANIKGHIVQDIDRFFPMYFGNMGKGKRKKFVWCDSLQLEFFSFNKELINIIDDNIDYFFACTNFGSRQSKGFGSFYPEYGDISTDGNFLGRLDEMYDLYFLIDYNDKGLSLDMPNKDIMQQIDSIYSLMKGGINLGDAYHRGFIFKYLHKRGIGNEKKFIKDRFPVPKEKNYKKDNSEKRFGRAVLGLAGTYMYRSKEYNSTIVVSSKEIDRFTSPITFKVVEDLVAIIPSYYLSKDKVASRKFIIPDEILNETFKFSYQEKRKDRDRSKIQKAKPQFISTPKEFDIQDFLISFTDYFNNLQPCVSKNGKYNSTIKKAINDTYIEKVYKAGDANA